MQIKTHTVDVEGIGKFVFKHRSMRLEMAIAAEYSDLVNGSNTPTNWLDTIATVIATLVVLTVEAPEDWDIESVDITNVDECKELLTVYNELCGQEARFPKAGKAGGQEAGGDGRPLVQTDVQTST